APGRERSPPHAARVGERGRQLGDHPIDGQPVGQREGRGAMPPPRAGAREEHEAADHHGPSVDAPPVPHRARGVPTPSARARATGRWGVQALAGKRDRAWMFYKRKRPGGGEPTWKATFLRRVQGPAGERYVVGSGVYDLVPDRRFVIELVDMAAERIERDGRAALALVRDRKGPFV